MILLVYGLTAITFFGGLLLIFGRDWVWKIDSRSEAHKRDANGNPIRTDTWDRMHFIQGLVMVGVSLALAVGSVILR